MKDDWISETRSMHEGRDKWVFNFVWATSDEENAWRTRLRLENVPDTEVRSNIRCENVNWIELAPVRVKNWKVEESKGFVKAGNFLPK
jgi:hypothetical protein